MFKSILVSLTLVLSLSAHALTEHSDGSVTLSKDEVEQLNLQVNSLLQQAYAAGVEKGVDVVKSNPKLCPKNI